ncbi:3-hydroxyisobutyrate dehydrogenase [Rhizobium sp. Root73]|uniref:NAD(P)-dependent oxidoreductase n=1 Tax=unclassified Rhizobium TaxID=2613769 RepID=UPI000728375D|nr:MULTISPECIES: NAD(P)-binding domain-containing protein [unclassified Rhizobium]KQY13070.1 3-hydroxyisobutyrate dehydrogenase [Rhizobium sp. Root1334]KRC12586.1 3-hydroxyisobutyrate dehydrogenase [Rhizobium sp. Root73]
MSDVAMIGLGRMGGALAKTLVTSGKSVTVWNRSQGKTDALERIGALKAETPAAAIASSSTLIVCLSDYAATSIVLDGSHGTDFLEGKTVVQLTSGTPKQARHLERWVEARGGTYLDGAISAWPDQIGGPEASIVIAGRESVLTSAEPILKLLAPNLSHVGTDIGRAKILFNAALSYFAGHWIGFSHGAAMYAAEGMDVAEFGEAIAALSPMFADDVRHMGQAITGNRFADPQSTIKSVGVDISRLVEIADDLNISAAFPEFAASLFRNAAEAGYGAEEHCAIFKVIRSQ